MNEDTLHILQDAIADVGYWRWWIVQKDICQVEFGGVQLYAYNKRIKESQSSILALQFYGNSELIFYSKEKSNLKSNWPDLLYKDKLEPFSIKHSHFLFNDEKLLDNIEKEYRIKIIKKKTDFKIKDKIFLSYMAGDVAVYISGQDFKVIGHSGELDDVMVRKASEKWWKYWKEYWKSSNKPNAYEKDYACEVTIPVGNK